MLCSHLQKLIQIRTKYFGNMFTPVCLEPRSRPNLHWTLKEGGWTCISRCNEKQHEYRRKTLWNIINDGWIKFLNPKMQKISILTQDDLTQKCYFFIAFSESAQWDCCSFILKVAAVQQETVFITVCASRRGWLRQLEELEPNTSIIFTYIYR